MVFGVPKHSKANIANQKHPLPVGVSYSELSLIVSEHRQGYIQEIFLRHPDKSSATAKSMLKFARQHETQLEESSTSSGIACIAAAVFESSPVQHSFNREVGTTPPLHLRRRLGIEAKSRSRRSGEERARANQPDRPAPGPGSRDPAVPTCSKPRSSPTPRPTGRRRHNRT